MAATCPFILLRFFECHLLTLERRAVWSIKEPIDLLQRKVAISVKCCQRCFSLLRLLGWKGNYICLWRKENSEQQRYHRDTTKHSSNLEIDDIENVQDNEIDYKSPNHILQVCTEFCFWGIFAQVFVDGRRPGPACQEPIGVGSGLLPVLFTPRGT